MHRIYATVETIQDTSHCKGMRGYRVEQFSSKKLLDAEVCRQKPGVALFPVMPAELPP